MISAAARKTGCRERGILFSGFGQTFTLSPSCLGTEEHASRQPYAELQSVTRGLLTRLAFCAPLLTLAREATRQRTRRHVPQDDLSDTLSAALLTTEGPPLCAAAHTMVHTRFGYACSLADAAHLEGMQKVVLRTRAEPGLEIVPYYISSVLRRP